MSDFKVGDTIYHHFSTRAFATGIPTTLAGTPVAEAYEEASATGITAGVSLTIDHAETGHHLLTVVATGANSFETGKMYGVSLTAGTVGGVSVVGEVIFNFSLEKSSAAQDLANGTDGLTVLKSVVDAIPTTAMRGTDSANTTTPPTAAAIVNEWETQSQADPTGFHVNLLEVAGTAQTAGDLSAQIGAIGASAGGALNFEANADNSGGTIDPGSTSFVGNETNNYTDTDLENGTRHVITDATNVIDLVYGFSVGGGRTATEMIWKGFANANNDNLTISVWDHPGSEWETLGTLTAANSTTNMTITEALLSKHTGTGAESGKVYIRFNGSSLSSSADLNTDQILIEAVGLGQSIGYAGGQIWVNTGGVANTGTEDFVDGVADNTVSTIAAAKTLSTSLGLSDFHIINGSSITLAESTVKESYFGDNWTLALGTQDCGGAFFEGADVTGTATGSSEMHFSHCEIGDVTVAKAHFDDCDIEGTVTLSAADTYNFIGGSHSGGTPTIDFGSSVGNTTVHVHNYHGALTVKNMGQTGTDVLHWSSPDGKLTLDSTCIAGTVNLNGTFDLVNNGSGQTLNRDGDAMQTLSKMVFTKTNELDVNTKSINDAEVIGDGNATPWDGA